MVLRRPRAEVRRCRADVLAAHAALRPALAPLGHRYRRRPWGWLGGAAGIGAVAGRYLGWPRSFTRWRPVLVWAFRSLLARH